MVSCQMIEVIELFKSVQGEGPSCGQPALFVRLRRCQLRCSWCDSRFSWDSKDPDYTTYTTWDEKKLAYELKSDAKGRIVVITGGEPLIWKRQLVKMLSYLRRVPRIEIETNGTIPVGELAQCRNVYFNVSPKLSSSGNEGLKRINEEALRGFAYTYRAVFKFVVTSPLDINEIEILERQRLSPIWVMPEGVTVESQIKGLKWLAPIAIQRNWSISLRLHILAFGNRRRT